MILYLITKGYLTLAMKDFFLTFFTNLFTEKKIILLYFSYTQIEKKTQK